MKMMMKPIGPRQIGPQKIGPRKMAPGKLCLSKLSPWQIGPLANCVLSIEYILQYVNWSGAGLGNVLFLESVNSRKCTFSKPDTLQLTYIPQLLAEYIQYSIHKASCCHIYI